MLILGIVVTVVAIFFVLCLLIDRILSVPSYHGPFTDHFDGNRFHNVEPPKRKSFLDFLRWQSTAKRGAWEQWTDSEFGSLPPTRVNESTLRVTFINHATVLIQTEGLNILTDPIWSERASPVTWAGPRRHRSPGIRFEDLPPIDFVLIGHNHYDHLDIKTLVRLRDEHRPRFITGLGNGAFLNGHKIRDVTELDWWDSTKISNEVIATCVPAKHFSGRGLSDRDVALWCGFVIQAPAGNIYFAGDTGMGSHFREIKERFNGFRLALLPIGAYLPRWFMHPVHLSPSEAIEVHHMLDPSVSLAIHFGTFALGDDGQFEPIADLRAGLNDKDDSNFWILEQGEGRDVPSTEKGINSLT